MWKTVLAFAVLAGCGGSSDSVPHSGFGAWGSSTTSVTAQWDPVAGATGYMLERIGRDPVMLDAAAVHYLDRDLAPGDYAYRLTAIGVDSVQESQAHTSEDAAVITTDDAPVGDPVVAAIGSAGGMIELTGATVILPPGAVPDGSTVTVQPIHAPTGFDDDLAIEVSSDTGFATPIDVSFALDDDDQLQLQNLAFAAKQDDGTWVTVDTKLATDRAVVHLVPAASARASALTLRQKLVRFRGIRITPGTKNVRKKTQEFFLASAVFSDNVCEPNGCAIKGPINDFGGWLGGAPIVNERLLRNNQGSWSLGGPGKLEVHSDERVAVYTAPDSKPSKKRWPITFTLTKSGDSGSATIIFLDNSLNIHLIYDNYEGIGANLEANVHDEWDVIVEFDDAGIGKITSGPHNSSTEIKNEHVIDTSIPTMRTSPYEVINVTSAKVFDFTMFDVPTMFFTADGTSTYAGTILTLVDGSKVTNDPKTEDSSINFSINGHWEDITSKTVIPTTDESKWTVVLSPSGQLP